MLKTENGRWFPYVKSAEKKTKICTRYTNTTYLDVYLLYHGYNGTQICSQDKNCRKNSLAPIVRSLLNSTHAQAQICENRSRIHLPEVVGTSERILRAQMVLSSRYQAPQFWTHSVHEVMVALRPKTAHECMRNLLLAVWIRYITTIQIFSTDTPESVGPRGFYAF